MQTFETPFWEQLGAHARLQLGYSLPGLAIRTRPHPAEGGSDVGALDVQMGKSMALLKARGWTGPVWVTEGGWATGTDPACAVSELAQARHLVRMAVINRSFVERFYVYALNDGKDIADGQQNMGLLCYDGSRKPAFQAYRVLAAIIDARTTGLVRAYFASAPTVRAYHLTRSDGTHGWVLWTLDGSTRVTVAGLTPVVRRTRLLGDAVRLGTIDGRLTVTATPHPLYLETV